MSRPGEAVTEFWFEQAGSETPVMRGPGVAVAFSQSRGLVHAFRIEPGPSAAATGLKLCLMQAASVPDQEHEQSGGRRIGNPLYQELVPHELAHDQSGGICALLTGSCFNHHFSAVFSLGRDQDAPGCIVFDIDVADRCRGPVEKLAATYIVCCPDLAIETTGARSSSLIWEVGGGLLELVALPPAIIDEPTSSCEGMRIQIQARIEVHTHTQRLHYRWRWASCPDLTR
jgi:hypothetical protein